MKLENKKEIVISISIVLYKKMEKLYLVPGKCIDTPGGMLYNIKT
ncbi:MAG: hypothetical protein K0S41_4171 [Anaerocolumna sp.]|jgi:hypothetical protein|nr:hypothetical protein [Anaerocolumna sp.]